MNLNDDIGAELRSHWREIADTRPAVDQLPAVLTATDQIKPRPSWAVRLAGAADALPWPQVNFAGQIAVVLLLVLLTVALGAGLAVVGGRPPAPSTPFEGRWVAVDVGDQSDMLLVVSAGDEPSVRYEDSYASRCALEGDSNTHWIGEGKGVIDSDTLVVSYDTSGCTTWTVPPDEQTYLLDEDTNTLTDDMGNTWRRP